MQVKSIAECSKGSILQYFSPSLSYHLSLRSLLCLFLSGRFTQVLLYINSFSMKTSIHSIENSIEPGQLNSEELGKIPYDLDIINCWQMIIWALMQENLSSGVWEQHRGRPACAYAQSDQRLCYSF